MRPWPLGIPTTPGWRVLVALTVGLGALATPGAAQTVEQRYEPFATGAVTTIFLDEAALGARDLVDLIQWHVPGALAGRCWDGTVMVTLRSGHTPLSDPGGSGETCPPEPKNPLLVIDGVKVSNDDFSWNILSLNPFLVERIEVLRDVASTAVYGIRGARGVILVYTRRH